MDLIRINRLLLLLMAFLAEDEEFRGICDMHFDKMVFTEIKAAVIAVEL